MTAHTVQPMSARRRLATRVALAGALAALGLIAAGCGGGSSPSVANLATTTSTTTTTGAAAPASGTSAAGAPPVSTSGGSTGQSTMTMQGGTVAQMTAYAACMRAHGVANFPDPNAQGVISASGLDQNAPVFTAASAACAKDIPHQAPSPAQQAQAKARALAYSACMRSHGLPNFPDPTFPSGGGIEMKISASRGSDLNPNSPVFQSAQRACGKDLPGVVRQRGAAGGGTVSGG